MASTFHTYPELVTDAGDIHAVIGTRVEVRAVPSTAVTGGRMVIVYFLPEGAMVWG